MQPFRIVTGEGIYPMSMKIPLEMTHAFSLRAFLPGRGDKGARVDLKPVNPFSVVWARDTTTVSLVTRFKIEMVLKGLPFPSIEIEGTNVALRSRLKSQVEDFESCIEILKPSQCNGEMKDEESVTSVFLFRPLTELGACLLADSLLHFMVDWRVANLRFTSEFTAELRSKSLGFALLLPPLTAEVMKTATVPMRITNLRAETRTIALFFEGGPIQPTTQVMHVPELAPGASYTLNISVLPLLAGEHRLDFWAEEDGVRIDPMFPTYITVVDPQ
jgi:hypothetical protein